MILGPIVALSIGLPGASLREHPPPPPPILREIGVDERLGAQLPLDLAFRDERGRPVRLGDYFRDEKPVLLVLAYYDCPMLCGLVLQHAMVTLHELGWTTGNQYRVLTVSFDAKDTVAGARAKQESALRALGLATEPDRWPFLVGDESSIAALTRALGFRFRRDRTGQLAHPAVVFTLTPRGAISRYLHGLDYTTRDLKLSLLEASDGKTGTFLERLLAACYAYDPATKRYGFFVSGFMKIGSLLIALIVLAVLVHYWRRDRRRTREEAA